MKISATAGKYASGKAEVRFRYGSEFQQSINETEIREAYVDLSAGPAGIKAGKLITPWGKGTLFNPVDRITPLDPTVRSPEEDDRYLGAWAMQGRISLGQNMKLTATWKPLYQPGVLLIDPVPMPSYVQFLEPEYPGLRLEEGSYGIHYDIRSRTIDLAFYWYDGYTPRTGIRFDSFIADSLTMQPVALNLMEKAYRIRMAGADFSVPLGSWIVRAEGAWSRSATEHGRAEYLPFPEFSYTAEIERAISHGTLLAGYFGKHIMDYAASAAEPSLEADQEQFFQLIQSGLPVTGAMIDEVITGQIGAFNRLYNVQLEKTYHTVFLLWEGRFLYERLEIRVPLIYNVTTGEWIFQPGLSYAPADGIRISAGFNAFYGPEGSLVDLAGQVLNAAHLTLKLTF